MGITVNLCAGLKVLFVVRVKDHVARLPGHPDEEVADFFKVEVRHRFRPIASWMVGQFQFNGSLNGVPEENSLVSWAEKNEIGASEPVAG
jgi:hypothetical protein